MKRLDLTKLETDPLSTARHEVRRDTSVVSGYIRSVGKDTISLAESQIGNSYFVIERSSVIAAFEDEKKESRVTLLVFSDAEIKIVTMRRLNAFKNAKKCKCSDVGIAEARPLSSIDKALGEFAREMDRIKDAISKGSSELSCAEKRNDCFGKGKSEEECNFIGYMCNLDDFFNN